MIHSIVHLSNLNGKCVRIRLNVKKTSKRGERERENERQQEIGENLIRDRRLN